MPISRLDWTTLSQGHEPDDPVESRVLFPEITRALSKEGDEDDPLEQAISEADLEEEMEEANTTLKDVVGRH